MSLSLALQELLDQSLHEVSLTSLKGHVEKLMQTYRKGGTSPPLFETEGGCLTYLATRMPATYGAISAALQEMKKRLGNWEGKTLLDLGAGPGTASWAACEEFASLNEAILIEKSGSMIQWGKKLGKNHPVLSQAKWIQGSLVDLDPLPKADLVLLSYTLNELQDPKKLIQKIWDAEIGLGIFVEPGTPAGFLNIKRMRDFWLRLGGSLIAPCPHADACPISGGDWCHFSARISRAKIHRLLKGGDLGHEDEKFSYLIVSREPQNHPSHRILRHPLKNKGHIQMVVCNSEGKIENKTITQKTPELYKWARKAEWGDSM